jgi:aryl-alcohol dehydrogenase-like predicted oxidoreductase
MKYANLGKNRIESFPICLGTMSYGQFTMADWVLDEEESRRLSGGLWNWYKFF